MFIAEGIKKNNNISTVYMRNNAFRDGFAEIIGDTFNNRQAGLATLDISQNMISDCGGKLLAEGLFENRTLTHLNISKNNLEEYSGRLFALIFQGFERREGNTTLKYLNLEGN